MNSWKGKQNRLARVAWYGSGNNPRENLSKMAVSEEVAENVSALDAKTVDEGTVVELLRKRYNRDEVYLSGFNCLASWLVEIDNSKSMRPELRPAVCSGKERGLTSRTAVGNRA